ncbi:MAG: TonB family protein [Pseudomonadota bacterium]
MSGPASKTPAGNGRLLQGLGISLLLHGALVVPWLMRDMWTPPAPPSQQLALELFGMVSNRQVEKLQEKKAPAPVKQEARPVARIRGTSAPSPVQVRAIEPPAPPPIAKQEAAPIAPAPVDGADYERVQQTTQSQETEANRIRNYVAALSKAIQARLVYPGAAREAGYVGSPSLRFTLADNGEIVPGTLAVHKSSGYHVLDENAMQAVQASTPFGKPPRKMSVVIALSFAQDR